MEKTRQIDKRTRETITSRIQNEIYTARTAKRARVTSWHKNEKLLEESDRFKKEGDTRSQIALHKMNGYIQTILSKIDDPLVFKFLHNKIASKRKVEKYNAIRELDANKDNWDFKDLLGKDYGIFYGRAIYFYHATGDKKEDYKAHLDLIDPYDFLIDPKSGGLDIEKARYMGHYNVRFSKTELEEGAKSGKFIKDAVKELTTGESQNSGEVNEEDLNKKNRYSKYAKQISSLDTTGGDDYIFWAWITTYEGERYYALYSETGIVVKMVKLTEIVPSGKFPYWTWACFPKADEFWTMSYADIARDVIQGQSVAVNQMMDNADRINNPQRIINTTALVDENELRFKKRGFIRANTDVSNVVQDINTPSIETPLAVYETLDNILQLNSGVTGATQGIAEEDKVGIYEGNQVATADRFNLLNKSYSNGNRRFAMLWKEGVDNHLNKDMAIKLVGPDGIEMETFTEDDKLSDDDVDITIESGNSEAQTSQEALKTKIMFLDKYRGAQFINPKVMFELEADIVGVKKDEVKRLLSLDDSSADVQVEAYRDIEDLIKGKKIQPNEIADTTYAQIVLDYMKNQKENLSNKQYTALEQYLGSIQQIVIRNMTARAQQDIARQALLAENQGVPNIINNQQV